jgi:phosphoglycerate dehydrogenase-like enzyme
MTEAFAAGRSDAPVTVLLSRQAARDFGVRIEATLPGQPVRLVAAEDVRPTDVLLDRIDIAFLSRDVTADTTYARRSPQLKHFHDLLTACSNLRWLQIHAAGSDRDIYAELQRRSTVVTTGSGVNAVPVAQMALTGLLMLARQMPSLLAAQRRHEWSPLLGPRASRDLRGQRAVVVGLGAIGQEIAWLLSMLGMQVTGVRRTSGPMPDLHRVVTPAELDEVLVESDWLVLACPLTAATTGLVDARRLALMPRGAGLVNVARGRVVVESALQDALASGQIAGAFLDVFEEEPLPTSSPLWDMPNVIVSPHTASHVTGLYEAVGDLFLDNLGRWHRGEALRNVAEPRGG